MSHDHSKTSLFTHLKRDALAGTVTGVMAVPLSAGICLMSDYPIMTGLYTVILACIVGFITFLVRPGNYVGVPGVAAGLAPALALGVSTFGMENMPFVIALTATMQAIVWHYRLEGYILRLVPHYLVEGLLAGVGLKIALKFIPFLYLTEGATSLWLSSEQGMLILLSLSSFALFVFLYQSYKNSMPALSYFVVMATGIGLSYIFPLPMLSIESAPLHFALPLPNFGDGGPALIALTALEMVLFAAMLATIDIIEQVMSNVAIERLDPLNRQCDTNNSLLAIWISNLGATFFGGMTNLDGLAKSTTNAVAGAYTKVSNLFTAAVLLLVVLFPIVLGHMPKYALGIIMVYSGWKMIANLAHVRSDGKYPFLLAALCGLLVFQLGIFEGLLIVLAAHGTIHYLFQRRLGKSARDVMADFRRAFREHDLSHPETTDRPRCAILDSWLRALNEHNIDALLELYASDSVDVPAFSTRVRNGLQEIRDYYESLFQRDGFFAKDLGVSVSHLNGTEIDTALIGVGWREQGFEKTHMLRISCSISDNKILSLHTSVVPVDQPSPALAKNGKPTVYTT